MMKKIVLAVGFILHCIFSWSAGIDVPLRVTGNEIPEWVHGQNKTLACPSLSMKYDGNVFYVESRNEENGMLEVSFYDDDNQLLFDTCVYITYNKVEFLVPEELLERSSCVLVTFRENQYVGMLSGN